MPRCRASGVPVTAATRIHSERRRPAPDSLGCGVRTTLRVALTPSRNLAAAFQLHAVYAGIETHTLMREDWAAVRREPGGSLPGVVSYKPVLAHREDHPVISCRTARRVQRFRTEVELHVVQAERVVSTAHDRTLQPGTRRELRDLCLTSGT